MSPFDFPASRDRSDFCILLNLHNETFVFTARLLDGFPQGEIGLSEPQRTWASISITDTVDVTLYDPFQEGGNRFLGSLDVDIGFAGSRNNTDKPLDQDELAQHFTKVLLC